MQLLFGVKPARYPDGTSLANVAIWNFYGTETIPPRPVLRIAAENVSARGDIKDALANYLDNVIKNPIQADHGRLEKEMLRKIAVQVIKEAQRIIEAGGELQENSPATTRMKELKKSKGVGKPLYDTGLLLKNLGYEYEDD